MTITEILIIILTLIFLEGILSIDNAAVLGAMAGRLPADKPVPWPQFLRRYAPALNKVFGHQRAAALKVGLLGAYLGRGLMLLLATWIINNPWLKLLGGFYLFKLGLEGISIRPREEEETKASKELASNDFWTVVLAIELADLAFSIDNVAAAVAISDKLWVIMVGVAIGIVTMRYAAGIFTWLIAKEPLLNRSAYMLVVVIGLEIFLKHFLHLHVEHWQRFLISGFIILMTVIYSRFLKETVLRRILRSFGIISFYLNEALNQALLPVRVTTRYTAKQTLRTSRGLLAAVYLAVRAVERRLRREKD